VYINTIIIAELDNEFNSFFPKEFGTPERIDDLSTLLDLINAKAGNEFSVRFVCLIVRF
jgi:hypothetical protein